MAWNKVMMNMANNDSGYAVFLEMPQTHKPVINVMTEKYVKNIIPFANAVYMKNMGLGDYQPPADRNSEKLITDLHQLFLTMGYTDRTPHGIEIADQLFDYNENEQNPDKKIIEVKKRYQLMMGGTLLVPPYPELLPMPFMPLPPSPI
jgi:hypothetical protein